ncbi:hypothetical protein [Gloeocapsopsis sp. IPPAS B-1203]|nr:hypothetical protein [Gloeocapsopsis sp. IPPAS B-1203]
MKYIIIAAVSAISLLVITKSPGTLTFGFVTGIATGTVLGVAIKS